MLIHVDGYHSYQGSIRDARADGDVTTNKFYKIDPLISDLPMTLLASTSRLGFSSYT